MAANPGELDRQQQEDHFKDFIRYLLNLPENDIMVRGNTNNYVPVVDATFGDEGKEKLKALLLNATETEEERKTLNEFITDCDIVHLKELIQQVKDEPKELQPRLPVEPSNGRFFKYTAEQPPKPEEEETTIHVEPEPGSSPATKPFLECLQKAAEENSLECSKLSGNEHAGTAALTKDGNKLADIQYSKATISANLGKDVDQAAAKAFNQALSASGFRGTITIKSRSEEEAKKALAGMETTDGVTYKIIVNGVDMTDKFTQEQTPSPATPKPRH